ncbi:nuclear transport factor 2 family protein [Nocardia suismassiliense]|uniref:nuclear transport factor 2 family protein n=1 Tax=Nocardia suismassiliense TaxID=2077092 RepID=UPI000D1F0277|nr:nuclear transport factor 2 family protein [Nocardia suismassiliense]
MDSAMDEATTTDAVDRFRAATKDRDFEAVQATLTPDATLISPLSGRLVFRGADDLRILLTAAYGGVSGLRWTEQIGDGAHRVLLAEAALGPFRFTEALVLELADDGRIRTLKPHLRPWLSLTALAVWLAPGLLKHPGVLRRAMRGASAP